MLFDLPNAEEIIQKACAFAAQSGITTGAIAKLRHEYPGIAPEILSYAFELADGTLHAQKSGKFSQKYAHWLFTRQTYEQSTSSLIAAHHARRFHSAKNILEICTGAGIDTAELSRTANVTTIEMDANIHALASRNFLVGKCSSITQKLGRAEEILTLLTEHYDALWADPSRRETHGKRMSVSADDYQPPLKWVMNLQVTGVQGIKISPAITFERLPPGWVREWIGSKHECKEQILWKNTDVTDGTVTLVESGISWVPTQKREAEILELQNAKYLVEPHPALIRSGYLGEFYREKSLQVFDRSIAYGVSTQAPEVSEFLTAFSVIESFPFNTKHLQQRLNELNWNKETEIKKRGFPELPDEVRKRLKFALSDERGVIFLTQAQGKKMVILAKRVTNPTNS